MALRLIAFDLDGTLLGSNNRMSAYTAASLKRAAAVDDLILVAASGRSHWAAELVLAACGAAVDYVICSNGALLWQRTTEATVLSQPIAADEVADLYAKVNELVPGACWAWETEQGIVPEVRFRELGTRPGKELDELRASPDLVLPGDAGVPIDRRLATFGTIVRGLLTHPKLPCAEIFERLDGNVPARLSSSSAIFLEVTYQTVHKAWMLNELCALEGIDAADVVAFGDHLNDLTMLQWAGRGIAMADAYPKLRAQADEVTDHGHDDDGVALAIEKLLADR